jgi:hypothetical protein
MLVFDISEVYRFVVVCIGRGEKSTFVTKRTLIVVYLNIDRFVVYFTNQTH